LVEVHVPNAAKRRLGSITFLVFPILWSINFIVVARLIVDLLFQFGRGVGIGSIHKGDQPFYFSRRLLSELGEAPERLLPLALLPGKAGGEIITPAGRAGIAVLFSEST
jgi:hypothetical protein